jgi:hypothetical protein
MLEVEQEICRCLLADDIQTIKNGLSNVLYWGYSSIAFHDEDTLLTYYVGVAGGPNLLDLKLCIVPTAACTA